MMDVSTYVITIDFHGVTYYGTLKTSMGPDQFLNHIAAAGNIGEGFKFAFPGEPIVF